MIETFVHSAQVVQEVLSDNSVAFNVVAELEDDAQATFRCTDAAQAELLAELINDCAGITVNCERGE